MNECLNLARNLHINRKKLGTQFLFYEKNAKQTKNHNFCTIARYRFTKLQQCNTISVITPPSRSMRTWTKHAPHASSCTLYAVYSVWIEALYRLLRLKRLMPNNLKVKTKFIFQSYLVKHRRTTYLQLQYLRSPLHSSLLLLSYSVPCLGPCL